MEAGDHRGVQPVEQAEAQIALRGLEGVDAELPAAANTYSGPRDPDALLAHLGHRWS